MKSTSVLISILLLGSLYSNCLSQQVYSFRYDDNGSRISRTIDMGDLQMKSSADRDSTYEKVFKEVIDDLEIILYPNPTKGNINITLKNFKGEEPSSITVYDFSGHIIQSQSNLQEANVIDLSGLPRATYLIKIHADGKRTEWKVIKE